MTQSHARYQEALKRGQAYLDSQRWKEAISVFRIALNEFPQKPESYVGIAEACLALKQLDRALEFYKLAARYSQGHVTHLAKVADIQERLGQLSEAGRTYLAAGELLLRERRLDDAIANWERAVRLEPNLLGAHRRLAMVFQRQNKVRDAVREYLAIARILQMQGDKKKALQMCQAALRLDPKNKDVLTAVELIRHGEEAFAEEEVEAVADVAAAQADAEADALTETVRQMAAIFEAERKLQTATAPKPTPTNPVEMARRTAQEQLAEEIFRDEEEEDQTQGNASLSKLERDALIGQGMDFESRGQVQDAITCYERAIAGGLRLAAAYFTLGVLYAGERRTAAARRLLALAARDPNYREASRLVFSKLQ